MLQADKPPGARRSVLDCNQSSRKLVWNKPVLMSSWYHVHVDAGTMVLGTLKFAQLAQGECCVLHAR